MKLHLPNRLRKSLLACLAAVASFLPFTSASGAAALGGLCFFSLSSATVLANDSHSVPQIPEEGWGGKSYQDLTEIDASSEASSDKTSSLYFVWALADNGHYTLKFFSSESALNNWKQQQSYTGDVFTITYQNVYSATGVGSSSWSWQQDEKGFLTLVANGGASDIRLIGQSHAQVVNQSNNIIDAVFAGLTSGTQYGTANGATDGSNSYDSDPLDSSYDVGGAAIFLSNQTTIDQVSADFIYNHITGTSNPHGGAIYIGYGSGINNLSGNFIGNYVEASSKGVGGAILNWGKIGKLEGNFIGNYIKATGTSNPIGGVIANGAESINANKYDYNNPSTIESIKGVFVGNYLRNEQNGDVIGATIANYGRIGKIEGVFIGNYSYAYQTANSGVLRNYSRNSGADTRTAIIGPEKWDEKQQTPVISGIFIGNYAQGVIGDGYGGVMRNNGEIHGSIEGLFVGNYATTEGAMITSNGSYQVGHYDFLKDDKTRQNRGMAYGGAIYNELKISPDSEGSEEGAVAIGDINSTFIDNYVASKYGEGFGGAIFNQDATIENIQGAFSGNHAVSEYFVARGGAIFNNQDQKEASIKQIGANNLLASFSENFAKGKMAQGGAIYVSSEASVDNIYAAFSGNYTESAVKDDENEFYVDQIQYRGKNNYAEGSLAKLSETGLHPTAQGGAIYVADAGHAKNIVGLFENNYARTSGVGYSSVAARNKEHLAQGGAIYVANDGVMEAITANFSGNYVETLGIIEEEGITAQAQGGAIYVDQGVISNIYGNFIQNEAAAYSIGDKTHQVSGGAIYVSTGGEIGNVIGQGGKSAVFQNNKAVSTDFANRDTDTRGGGDLAALDDKEHTAQTDAATIEVRGGAIYVADRAHMGNIEASFLNNMAESSASNNAEETVQGGAIYLADGGYINNIGQAKAQVQINENKLIAQGKGSALSEQTVQGGAIYVSKAGEKGYSIQNIYADEIKNNTITVATSDEKNERLTTRVAQGGAIYLADGADVSNIGTDGAISEISGNAITVTNGHEENATELTAGGGALFVATESSIQNIYASFTKNVIDTSGSAGNAKENLSGGAIYVRGGASIQDIGTEDARVEISHNQLKAGGLGVELSEQVLQGGAVYVGLNPDTQLSGMIGNIYADFEGNEINASFGTDAKTNELTRTLQGGAIYLADGAHIGSIMQKKQGFAENRIAVTSGNDDNAAMLTAQGGALYVANAAYAETILASFDGNEITSKEATGNKSETLQGGAIYLADGAYIGDIGSEKTLVTISNNSLEASGRGNTLEEQMVEGGAIYVSEAGVNKEGETISIGAIYADFEGNRIIASAEKDNTTLKTRTMRGGAIYVSQGGQLQQIYAGTEKKGFVGNCIEVSGGNEAGKGSATLTAQGGAIFLDEKSKIEDIEAGFDGNYISTTAHGNTNAIAEGGAIYVSGESELGTVGLEDAPVEIKNNYVTIGEQAVNGGTDSANMAQKYAKGGAIYLAEGGKMGDVHASFAGNYASAAAGSSSYVETQVYGGALFVAENGVIGSISGNFSQNYADAGQQSGEGSMELAHGGAIDVAKGGKADFITGNFTENYVKNSGAELNGSAEDEGYGSDRHAKGGAIYLAEGGSVIQIGDEDAFGVRSVFRNNYAEGSGEVRGGAIVVTEARVDEIKGDFYSNYATGEQNWLTYGGAIRFKDAVITRLESNFVNNHTNGSGGALSVTDEGYIYEVTGNFIGNYSGMLGGAVHNVGHIGVRGKVELVDGATEAGVNYQNVKRKDDNTLVTVRDATNRYDETEGKVLNAEGNKQGRWEYDGSFTGGFVNSSFLYNTIEAQDFNSGSRGFGAGIYTDSDLFITVNSYSETIMSGNHVTFTLDGAQKTEQVRSAIYVDNQNYKPETGESDAIVIYLVARENGILRIDDNIRGYNEDKIGEDGLPVKNEGFILRLRGYTTNVGDNPHKQESSKTGLVILNNRVEESYSIMDDVTLYIGYKARTYQDADYFGGEGKNNQYVQSNLQQNGGSYVLAGDGQDIIRPNSEGGLDNSPYLTVAGTATRGGKELARRVTHQSDVFRDSHMSVRSGLVTLTDTIYSKKDGRFTDMSEEKEAFTEYLFRSLIAYGADYNYADFGARQEAVSHLYAGSSLEEDSESGIGHGYKTGSEEGVYAKFEFGVGLDSQNLYELSLANKYYYDDEYGNLTEEQFRYSQDGEVIRKNELHKDENGNYVNVKRQMAESDMLTVFAVAKEYEDGKLTLDWSQTSRGRVTLNGLSVLANETAWQATKKAVDGEQTDDAGNKVPGGDHYNKDLYLQLINFVLLDSDRKQITDERLDAFYQMFEEADKDDMESGYHLLRLSDHFDLIHNATAYMKGSDILADEIELATTVTKNDSIHLVNWRDHLAEWAEHEGSWTGDTETITDEDGYEVEIKKESGSTEGKKHFLLDQNVYYLNRNINLLPNPEDGEHTTGKEMWGNDLTLQGTARKNVLDLQRYNMLSLIVENQEVRLQSFTLLNVQDGLMQNEGKLTFDTMQMEDSLVVNNAGNPQQEDHRENSLTITGIMDINFTVTTDKVGGKQQYGDMRINHSTQVMQTEYAVAADSGEITANDEPLKASVIHILNTVEHQDVTHEGKDDLVLDTEKKEYHDTKEQQPALDTWYIKQGNVDDSDIRESFTTNTYLDTTTAESNFTQTTSQFEKFQDNSLTMEGGAFNLGVMYKHRLNLRYFNVNGGGVFVNHSTVDLAKEVMGGIDAQDGNASYAGDTKIANDRAGSNADSGSGDGLIWLQGFNIENTSDKKIVHVKFVDDGVGEAVKDGMGIANGSETSGKRIMLDGAGMYEWSVTFNDPEAVNDNEAFYRGKTGVRGMYTFRRLGMAPENFPGPSTDLTGSYVSMMQVYNYSFEHADLYSSNIQEAREQQLYSDHYSAVDVKGKNSPVVLADSCPPSTVGLRRGLWLHTYASAEKMPLRNGPEVNLNMYGGLIGGDTALKEHRSGWASVWSFYGGYLGSTQSYDGVRIRQNGAAIGATGTFYKKRFYTALTASVGVSQATATGRGGSENFDMLMGGIASRSGYNFYLDDGDYVLQPNLLVSYTLFNTYDYTNAFGSKIHAKPTGVLQLHPFLKLIKNTDCTWKPYGKVGFVYNLLGKTQYTVNGTSMPSMSIKPYAEYSVGAQRTYNDRYTVYGELTGRNGGRNGGEVSIGIRRAW